MNKSQMHLHSEKFDLCRVCLLEPESNRHINFIHIFSPENEGLKLNQHLTEIFGIKVEKDDVKPKIICENCHNSLMSWIEMKKKATEAQIVINYIATKKFGVTVPGTSNASYSSPDSRHREEFNNESSSYTNCPSTSKKSNINSNGCSSSSSSTINTNNKQGNSSRSFTNHSKPPSVVDSDSDDDISCLEITNPVETIEILSSDNEELVNINFKNEHINESENETLYYCSICQKKNVLNHNCSQYNKSFFTCLVPNCNILSRSKQDFTPHYRRHIGLSSTAVMCRRCYQEIKKTDRDASGFYHIRCRTVNLFKCYACYVVFSSMEEFAYHKLKTHNGRLMNSRGNYLCFYCEKSSPDLTDIIDHTKHCLESQANNVSEYGLKLKEPTVNETICLPVKKIPQKNTPERKRDIQIKVPRASTYVLFTCLKPSCNLIFQNFNVFKFHHREHFELGNKLMCWQCCVPFSNLNGLRAHQVKGNCRTPGMFKCYECSEQFDDLQSLSIHKFTLHDGDLIANKKNNKTIMCAYCHMEIPIHNFKSHLMACRPKNVEKKLKIKPKSTYTKKYNYPYKCVVCNKVCLTAAALASHLKTHNPSSTKRTVKKRTSNTSLRTEKYLEVSNSSLNQATDINQSTTSQHNGTVESTNNDMTKAGENNEMDVDINASSDNYLSNETIESVDYDTIPTVNYMKCNNCPRKFKSNSGLTRHWQFCDQNNILKTKPHNYYCTKCKKYFTRLTFFQHFKINHGQRLQYHKYRRYSCKYCPFKFMYKIALAMHNEHVHSEQIAVKSNLTPTKSVVMLPIISETTSLAKNIPETTSLGNNIPETTSLPNNVPETTSLPNNVPETSLISNILETAPLANNIPETTTENNETLNIQIKQEANANTLSNQWDVSDKETKKNITEQITDEKNNEISDQKNNEEQDKSNINDGENVDDVYSAQSINQIIDQLNDSGAIEDIFNDKNTMAVNNTYSMDVSECVNNYTEKTNTKIENDTSSSIKEEEKQNCLGGKLVAVNDTLNVNHIKEIKIIKSVQEFSTSSEGKN